MSQQRNERVETAVASAQLLQDELTAIENKTHETENSNLNTLRAENSKLAYRLKRLKTATEELTSVKMEPIKIPPINYDQGVCIMSSLDQIFIAAVASAFPGIACTNCRIGRNTAKVGGKPTSKKGKKGKAAAAPVEPVEEAQYQSSIAMSLFKELKDTPMAKKSPLEVAQTIVDNLPKSELIDRCATGGVGFVNIYINKATINKLCLNILKKGVLAPPVQKKLKVVVDFSSPNIAKEMHVGHLRSTIIGECICRMLEYSGHDVDRVNHIGDWGTQFGQLIANLQDEYPNYKTEELPLKDLQVFYKASKKRFDSEPEFKKRAHQAVVDLQAGDADVTRAWKLIVDVSRREYQKVYKALDVTLYETGESFYQSRMIALVKELEQRGLIEDGGVKMAEMAGCKVLWAQGQKTPLIIEKSNGGFGYDTSDLATIRYRSEELKGDWLIYVVDKGQSTHFEQIFQGARDIGFVTEKQRVDHVSFGVVLGEDGKRMKSRSGDTVTLKSVLDEGLVRATQSREAKAADRIARGAQVPILTDDEKAEADLVIGTSCLKYADLSCNRMADYKFSYDKMLADKGNTATYVISAYTRVSNVFKQKEMQGVSLNAEAGDAILLENFHPMEWKLAQHLVRFPDELRKAVQDLFPHTLCDFLYELAATIHEFYEACHIISKKTSDDGVQTVTINRHRLLQFAAAGKVMEQCFYLVGLKFVEKM